ncbi:Asp-tRNA(Asn)/Glu-tRNA(Gln) amidotransferase subunit GatC [Bartonella sp. DGB1]|uniref:Asp-tRNA(Asn)/Glu-tRNA(Gln) amidotransferase subunit GatC n=1 Tax=Bartonella sp. DGB1 TaxID=3239807 RepID=UPI003525EDEC
MTIDIETIEHIAKLARIALTEEEKTKITAEFTSLLAFLDCLNEVDTNNVTATASIVHTNLSMRPDIVNDGDKVKDILANAPLTEEGFFLVPKVVE